MRVLQRVPLLHRVFSEGFLGKMALAMKEAAFDAEELVLKENVVETPALFIILKGAIELSLEIGQRGKR